MTATGKCYRYCAIKSSTNVLIFSLLPYRCLRGFMYASGSIQKGGILISYCYPVIGSSYGPILKT